MRFLTKTLTALPFITLIYAAKHTVCSYDNLKGHCKTYNKPYSTCHNYERENRDHWNSIKLDPKDDQYCMLFSKKDCYGDALQVGQPGLWYCGGSCFRRRREAGGVGRGARRMLGAMLRLMEKREETEENVR